jgi:hypothetical protein
MSGFFEETLDRNLEVAAGIEYPLTGWTWMVRCQYASALGGSRTFGYIWWHGRPYSDDNQIVIARNGVGSGETVGTIRVIIHSSGSIVLDETTTGVLVDDEPNSMAVMWDGTTFSVFFNGVQETFAQVFTEDLVPTDHAWIGARDHGGDAGEFAGLIQDVVVWQESFPVEYMEMITREGMSPRFVGAVPEFHTEMWDADSFGDLQNNYAVTAVSMEWEPQLPMEYPLPPIEIEDDGTVVPPVFLGRSYVDFTLC